MTMSWWKIDIGKHRLVLLVDINVIAHLKQKPMKQKANATTDTHGFPLFMNNLIIIYYLALSFTFTH